MSSSPTTAPSVTSASASPTHCSRRRACRAALPTNKEVTETYSLILRPDRITPFCTSPMQAYSPRDALRYATFGPYIAAKKRTVTLAQHTLFGTA